MTPTPKPNQMIFAKNIVPSWRDILDCKHGFTYEFVLDTAVKLHYPCFCYNDIIYEVVMIDGKPRPYDTGWTVSSLNAYFEIGVRE